MMGIGGQKPGVSIAGMVSASNHTREYLYRENTASFLSQNEVICVYHYFPYARSSLCQYADTDPLPALFIV